MSLADGSEVSHISERRISKCSEYSIHSTETHFSTKSATQFEKPIEVRKFALILYITVTGLIALFTSLSFFKAIGIMPASPDISRLNQAFEDYENFTETISAGILADMTLVYETSLENQSILCTDEISYIDNDRIRAQEEVRYYANNFRSITIGKIWDQLEANHLVQNSIRGNETCTESYKSHDNFIQENIIFFTEVQSSSLNSYAHPNDSSRILWAIQRYPRSAVERKSSDCFDSFDYFYIPPLDGSNDFRNALAFESTMIDLYADFESKSAQGLLGSIAARLLYDLEYLSRMFSSLHTMSVSTRRIRAALSEARRNIQEMNDKIQEQLKEMRFLYELFQAILKIIPENFVGGVDAPEAISPQVPDLDLAVFNFQTLNAEFLISGLPSYTPPKIIGFSVDSSLTAPTQNYTIEYEYAESSLIDQIKKAIEFFIAFVDRLAYLDLAVRLCLWLRECSRIIKVERRDMSTARSKMKRRVALLMKNSVYILYLSVVLFFAGRALSMDIDVSYVAYELQAQCQNDVILENTHTLSAFQNEILEKRSECNSVIQTLNLHSQQFNIEYLETILETGREYESFYQSSNQNETQFTDPLTNLTYPLTDFSIDYHQIDEARYGSNLGSQEIDNFQINASICHESEEAQQVEEELNVSIMETKAYVVAALVLVVLLSLSTNLLVGALKKYLWMELTFGYDFDTVFDGKMLEEKIKSKHRQAFIMTIMAMLLIFVASFYTILFNYT